MKDIRIVILTGPSCSGKTTLEASLIERGFASVRSTTTRPPRDGEVEGEHYNFVTLEEFLSTCVRGEFAEHIKFNKHRYGVTRAEIERVAESGKPIVMVAEPNGRDQMIKFGTAEGWQVFPVFVNSDPNALSQRFLQRFVKDMANSKDPVQDMESYAGRLNLMLTEERDWVRRSIGTYYAYRIDHYDAHCEARHIKAVCNIVGLTQPVKE